MSGRIVTARAYANNEVAYIAWDLDAPIQDCLGFEITRVYLDANGDVARKSDGTEDRVKCAAWVAFKGQRNPHWLPQDTGVWPVQKLSWRDLTLRKRRAQATRRPDEVRVRYEIRPVGDLRPGLEAVTPTARKFGRVVRRDEQGVPIRDAQNKLQYEKVPAFTGKARPLGYLDVATATDPIHVTTRRGPFRSTFTNGILAAQWLSNVLREDDGVIGPDELIRKLEDPDDVHRRYLAGDVIPLIRELLAREGEFYLGLYELEDRELEDLLIAHAPRLHVILSNTGPNSAKEWDERNRAARKRLVSAGVDIQHRMFNNSTHIGHNKFVVHVPPAGAPRAVFTGSTNWTSTGLAGQTNNALLIEDDAVAGVFLDYWRRLKADKLKLPSPRSAPMPDAQQSKTFRASNATAVRIPMAGGATVTTWFSPNMAARRKPTSKTKPVPVPPDLQEVYRLMRQAREAVLFLAFYPGMSGRDCIIGEAITLGQHDRSLRVTGVVSSAQAMPNYRGDSKDEDGDVVDEGESPSTYFDQNLSIVRAAKIDDRRLLGDFHAEQLTARGAIGAIVHDKVVVIDPRSKDHCHVVLGSHNLGYKASYSNDENLLIVSGDRALAEAYAVHVLDVYDHYRYRAIETELQREGKKGWSGFLATRPDWQDAYFDADGSPSEKSALSRYFAR